MRSSSLGPIKIGILGAGAGGVGSALAIEKKLKNEGISFEICLIDKHSEILRGSSDKTPGRAGLGYHYKDAKTGKVYMDATINFENHLRGSLRCDKESQSHYMRQSYYVVMKEQRVLEEGDKKFGSLFPVEQTLSTYEELKDHYAKKYKENPRLEEVFGHPDSFHNIYTNEEELKKFSEVLNLKHVAAVVRTKETLLDWPNTRAILCKKINASENITVQSDCEVISLIRKKNCFDVGTTKGNFEFDYVVNALWENLEKFDTDLDFQTRKRTNRLKAIVTVGLPESLKKQSSIFFCMGPHCMFSNMGDGTGMITYAPITNMKHSLDIQLPDDYKPYLYGKLTKQEERAVADEIIRGVASNYIPDMAKAKFQAIGFGIIKTYGDFDLMDPRSPFHDRAELGVEERQIGFISNSCMKLLYIFENGELVGECIFNHIKADKIIHMVAEEIFRKKDNDEMIEIAIKTCIMQLRRIFTSEFNLPDCQRTMQTKVALHKELINRYSFFGKHNRTNTADQKISNLGTFCAC